MAKEHPQPHILIRIGTISSHLTQSWRRRPLPRPVRSPLRALAEGEELTSRGDHSTGPLTQRVVKLVGKLLVLLLVHLVHGCDHPLHGCPAGRAKRDVAREPGAGFLTRARLRWGIGPEADTALGPLMDSQLVSDQLGNGRRWRPQWGARSQRWPHQCRLHSDGHGLPSHGRGALCRRCS